MKDRKPAAPDRNQAETRADRLKSALKANMAKRKAQLRARADKGAPKTDSKG